MNDTKAPRERTIAAMRRNNPTVELIDASDDSVQWTGKLDAWLAGQDPATVADWPNDVWSRLGDLCRHNIMVYFGGGAASLFVLRHATRDTSSTKKTSTPS